MSAQQKEGGIWRLFSKTRMSSETIDCPTGISSIYSSAVELFEEHAAKKDVAHAKKIKVRIFFILIEPCPRWHKRHLGICLSIFHAFRAHLPKGSREECSKWAKVHEKWHVNPQK